MELKAHLDTWFERCHQVAPARLARIDRKRLIQYFPEWGLRYGAEIGVDRGRFSEFMFQHIPNLKLYCIDNWHWKLRGESRYKSTLDRLKPYNATILRDTSMNALQFITDASLDFVYIDANHEFDFVMQDIIEWSKKVRPGGLVLMHDWYKFRGGGVVDAVNAYTNAHGIIQWFITDEKTPTAFWIRATDYPWDRK
jgi:predicted O-methyltransferase YrrM